MTTRRGVSWGLLMAIGGAAHGRAGSERKPEEERGPSKRTLEIRSYNLKPGSRAEFDRLAREVAVPMLHRWGIDVVGHGASAHDEDSYYLIRSFASLEERERREDAFYGSPDWRDGPRESILALIVSYTTVVVEMDGDTVERLRQSLRGS